MLLLLLFFAFLGEFHKNLETKGLQNFCQIVFNNNNKNK